MLNADDSEADWPKADVIVGNPPGESRNPGAKPPAHSATNLEMRPLAEENELDSGDQRNDGGEAIAAAAVHLNTLRENWLNPPEWVDWVITPEEEKAGFPKHPVAKPGFGAELKKRTLTNLYNARPAWLDMAHKALDRAVAAAYGWTDYTPEMPNEEILRRLLELNRERTKTRAKTLTCPGGNV
ncbi:hypothetical protein AGMMS50256_03900 [Betaproteobacteria bacterium]|nr:hypothetical protein AGMMS50256_03900 [Betaproteobacteria bacterium]